MKIGILTFHCAHNYGAVLQCYALQEFLGQQGYKVEIIDYRPNSILKPYLIWDTKRFQVKNPILFIKKSIIELFLLRIRIVRYKKFNSFITGKLNLSLKVKNNNIPSDYDAYIMGSDQIWNPKITKGFHQIYFGDLGFPKNNKKYISYAASMEATTLTSDIEAYFKEKLNNFDYLAVRESKLVELLQPLTGKTIKQVLDPTLLVDKSVWDNIAVKPHIKNKYVVVYQVRENRETMRIAKEIASQINGKVIELVAWLNWRNYKNKYQGASPEEFLGWIKYADCIITSSFHGTAFSIIFNRPFYSVYLNDGADSRSISLLNSLELKNRLISTEDKIIYSMIDFKPVEHKLKKLKSSSIKYLSASLKCK